MLLEVEDCVEVDDELAAGVEDPPDDWEVGLLELPPQAAKPSAANASSTAAHARGDRVVIGFIIAPVWLSTGARAPATLKDAGLWILVPHRR